VLPLPLSRGRTDGAVTHEGRGEELEPSQRAALASVAQAAEAGARELRRHRVEAARLALSVASLEGLAEVQEPGSACGEARGRRGLGR
jgi:hypothetical protein